MDIRSIIAIPVKQDIAREILESLQAWFGIPEAREEYIMEAKEQLFWAAFDGERAIGFLSLKETGKDTVELYVMGVNKAYHRHGIGKELFLYAKKSAMELGYSFIQVKTVQMGKYDEYDKTNEFYLSPGFKELEVFPNLWDEWNPCQVYIMSLQ